MDLINTVIDMNKTANDALDDSESKVNELHSYTKDGVTHIRVHYVPSEYELQDGVWTEIAPF